MYVTAYRDRGVDLDDVSFFYEKLAGFVAKFADLGFGNCSAGAEFRDGPVVGKWIGDEMAGMGRQTGLGHSLRFGEQRLCGC